LADSTSPPTITASRVERGSKKKRRVPLLALIVPIVLILVGVVMLLTLRGGAVPILGGDDDVTPSFAFTIRGARAVATSADADQEALNASAEALVPDITPTIDDLYTFAFLDPSNWHDGSYDEAFESFSPDAAQTAQESAAVLTLGADAGDVYKTVEPRKSSISYEILYDREGEPNTAVATVVFRALAQRKDGTYIAILSEGTLFLRDADGWKVTAFDVTRGDTETEPSSPSPSTSPSA
jgi:hypothetical protein